MIILKVAEVQYVYSHLKKEMCDPSPRGGKSQFLYICHFKRLTDCATPGSSSMGLAGTA